MDTELKPCPFCGEEAGICEANDICFHRDDDGNKIFGGWRCFCPSCAIEQIGYETREEAVSAWNNRSTEHATHRAPVDEKGGGRMTGIDGLRTLADAWGECGLGGELADVADEIERELSEELRRTIADMSPRLMPEGMEWLVEAWPRFEDSRPVRFSDDFERYGEENGVSAVTMYKDGSFALNFRAYSKGERVNRPAPKVYDADGAEVREKCDVWWICEGDERGLHAERLRVETILPDGLVECSPYNGGTWVSLEPSELYVNKPVPAFDGKPLREGETVWNVKTGREYVVVEPSYGKTVVVRLAKYDDAEGEQYAPDQLTHERPDTRARVIDGMDEETVERIDRLVKNGRWLDD